MVTHWDQILAQDPYVFAVAANDHYGPDNADPTLPARIRDSGKIILLAHAASLDAVRDAFQRGASFAVRDMGATKDLYPSIRSIVATDSTVTIGTDGAVAWIANGKRVAAAGPFLKISGLSPGYVRAEVSNGDGSIVYVQPFVIRPVGDANGDGQVDSQDAAVCAAVASGADQTADHIMACRRRK